MTQVSAAVTVLLAFFLVGVMTAWDGLMRHHIRLDIDGLLLHFHLRGVRAFIVGIIGLSACLLIGWISIYAGAPLTKQCHGSIGCVFQTFVIGPFTTWQTALSLVVFVTLFVYWLTGAFDLSGPYRRHMLAPGVWDREKELLALVARSRGHDHLPPVEEDVVLEMARRVRVGIAWKWGRAKDAVVHNDQMNVGAIVNILLRDRDVRAFQVDPRELRMVLKIVAQYYNDKYRQAAIVWPWRRKLFW